MKFKLTTLLIFATVASFAQISKKGKLDYSFGIDGTSYAVFETHNSSKALNDTTYFDLYRLGNDKKIAREIKYVINKKTHDTLKSGFYNVNYNNISFYLEGKKRPALERKYSQKNVNGKVSLVPKTSYLQIIPPISIKPVYEPKPVPVKEVAVGVKEVYYPAPSMASPKVSATVEPRVDVEANYPGGMNAMIAFLGKNVKYPAEAKKNNIAGRVNARFVVEEDGSITNINLERKLGYGCDEEVIRVIKLMPKWIPAQASGKPIRSNRYLPITFNQL
ncbi:MAG: energy transducer TonB [Pedobacter sp.]|nr:MAG: energy transducer TonB [Pedobacter sp.]